jgi:SAM-dependent methyltransferase
MRWSRSEIERLFPVLEQVSSDLSPVDGKQILVLCSGTGEVAFWLAEMMETGKVTGLELDPESLEIARRSAHEMGLEGVVSFQAAEKDHIPLPEASFDGLVSEFILYPTSMPTEIDQREMGRVLKPGGRIILTDVIVNRPLPQEVRDALQGIGLDHLWEGTQDDFIDWMKAAGLVNIKLLDMTSTVKVAWEARRAVDRSAAHWVGYSSLLEYNEFSLGRSIFYIVVSAEKPK